MIALYRLLHPVAGIMQKLQGRSIDVIDAYQNVNTYTEDIQPLRENVVQSSMQFSNKRSEWQITLTSNLILPELPRHKFIETMFQLIRLESTTLKGRTFTGRKFHGFTIFYPFRESLFRETFQN